MNCSFTMWADNTNLLSKGRYHSLYGWPLVFFVSTELLCLCWMNNSVTCLVKSKLIEQKVSRTVILPLIVSVLWCGILVLSIPGEGELSVIFKRLKNFQNERTINRGFKFSCSPNIWLFHSGKLPFPDLTMAPNHLFWLLRLSLKICDVEINALHSFDSYNNGKAVFLSDYGLNGNSPSQALAQNVVLFY